MILKEEATSFKISFISHSSLATLLMDPTISLCVRGTVSVRTRSPRGVARVDWNMPGMFSQMWGDRSNGLASYPTSTDLKKNIVSCYDSLYLALCRCMRLSIVCVWSVVIDLSQTPPTERALTNHKAQEPLLPKHGPTIFTQKLCSNYWHSQCKWFHRWSTSLV